MDTIVLEKWAWIIYDQGVMVKLIIVILYRPHNMTNPNDSEAVYQQQCIHISIMEKHKCPLKVMMNISVIDFKTVNIGDNQSSCPLIVTKTWKQEILVVYSMERI